MRPSKMSIERWIANSSFGSNPAVFHSSFSLDDSVKHLCDATEEDGLDLKVFRERAVACIKIAEVTVRRKNRVPQLITVRRDLHRLLQARGCHRHSLRQIYHRRVRQSAFGDLARAYRNHFILRFSASSFRRTCAGAYVGPNCPARQLLVAHNCHSHRCGRDEHFLLFWSQAWCNESSRRRVAFEFDSYSAFKVRYPSFPSFP
jgi:hypothetical protein